MLRNRRFSSIEEPLEEGLIPFLATCSLKEQRFEQMRTVRGEQAAWDHLGCRSLWDGPPTTSSKSWNWSNVAESAQQKWNTGIHSGLRVTSSRVI